MALGATLTIFWWFCRYIKEEAKPPFDDIKGFFFGMVRLPTIEKNMHWAAFYKRVGQLARII